MPIWLATSFDHCIDAEILRSKPTTRWTVLNIYNADFWEFQYSSLPSFRTESMIKQEFWKSHPTNQFTVHNVFITDFRFQISDFRFHSRFQISEFPKHCHTECLYRNCIKTLYSKSIQTLYKKSIFIYTKMPPPKSQSTKLAVASSWLLYACLSGSPAMSRLLPA